MRTSKGLCSRINHLLEEIEPTLPDLTEALLYLQEKRCSIHYDAERVIDIYSPGQKLSISVRRAVRKYHEQVVERMAAGDASICPTKWHEEYWQLEQGRMVCDMCRRLQPSVNPGHPVMVLTGGVHA